MHWWSRCNALQIVAQQSLSVHQLIIRVLCAVCIVVVWRSLQIFYGSRWFHTSNERETMAHMITRKREKRATMWNCVSIGSLFQFIAKMCCCFFFDSKSSVYFPHSSPCCLSIFINLLQAHVKCTVIRLKSKKNAANERLCAKCLNINTARETAQKYCREKFFDAEENESP